MVLTFPISDCLNVETSEIISGSLGFVSKQTFFSNESSNQYFGTILYFHLPSVPSTIFAFFSLNLSHGQMESDTFWALEHLAKFSRPGTRNQEVCLR